MSDDSDVQAFVEEVGLFFESFGLARMIGRVLGWLLVADPPHQTMAELQQGLQASKGSISTATRALLQQGLIERVALPGDRRDYVRLREDAWIRLNREKLSGVTALRLLAERGLAATAGLPAAQRTRLDSMRDVMVWYEQELPKLFERYEQEQQQRRKVEP